MKRFKLANVLLEVDDFLEDDKRLVYRLAPGSSAASDGAGGLALSGYADFCTYFNAVSVSKWKRYTDIVSVRLHIETAGDACTLETCGLAGASAGAPVSTVASGRSEFAASEDFKTHEVDMPFANAVLSGFSVRTEGTVRIRNAYYYTLVQEEQIRPVRIAVCTTTFKKEEFIVPNIGRIRAGILESDDALAQGFHLFVVDNGQTLDAQALSGGGVTVLPNVNAGGAGGFARGMMAAREHGAASGERFTHVILMDDDVRMSVESFKRTFALLSLAASEYARAFVNGAMLKLEEPSLQFEDVSHVRKTGGFSKIKPDIRVDSLAGIVQNESIDVEREGAYGAWWFSCIPMSYIEEMGLPLPFFVRCDDIEYGLRCKPTYMTMNGICVWHSAFEGRFNGAVACYQYVRNMLVTLALHKASSELTAMLRYGRLFRIYLRTMDYASAELWLDGMEDYLKGPECLMAQGPSDAMMRANAKAEKYRPVGELDPSVMGKLEVNLDWIGGEDPRSALRKAAMTIPHDHHWFPDFMQRKAPAMVNPDVGANYVPWVKTAMRSCLVALTPDGARGNIRRIDRNRHRQLVARYRDLMGRYRNTHVAVEERYREKMREMTSEAFWKRYLGL